MPRRRTGHGRVALLLGTALLTCACRKDEAQKQPLAPGVPSLARGDLVVVERATAEFFQGRVLAATAATLKVQTTSDGEPVVVAASDAYRVPPAAHVFAVGDPAICSESDSRWVACKIMKVDGATVTADLGDSGEEPLPLNRVLAPNPVTTLNLQRYFEALESRRRFDAAARAAGEPARPPGWLPEPGEPVIAKRAGDWYSARVQMALENRGVRVVWETDEHPESLGAGEVVPAPPGQRLPLRGEFALVKPKAPALPWERVRVDGTGPEEAVVVGMDGLRRRFPIRRLVPLAPKAPVN